jgi:hypothetical protein
MILYTLVTVASVFLERVQTISGPAGKRMKRPALYLRLCFDKLPRQAFSICEITMAVGWDDFPGGAGVAPRQDGGDIGNSTCGSWVSHQRGCGHSGLLRVTLGSVWAVRGSTHPLLRQAICIIVPYGHNFFLHRDDRGNCR